VPLAQRSLQLFYRRRVKEAERDAAFPTAHRVMQAMRHIKTLQIAAARHIAERPALMHQTVVHHKVEQAVGGHACAYPLQRPVADAAQVNQHD